MPELPEVEATRRLLEKHILGKVVKSVNANDDSIVFDKNTSKEFEDALKGRKVVALCRYGKVLWWDLDVSPHPSFHLGMTGGLKVKGVNSPTYNSSTAAAKQRQAEANGETVVKPDPEKEAQDSIWPPRFVKVVMTFTDGTEVAFFDARRFGRVRLHNDPRAEPPVCDLGFDPLLNMPSLEEFTTKINRATPIKALLLDQHFSAGVGNWVADEILYQSCIHPTKQSCKLTTNEVQRIYEKMVYIVRKACECNADSNDFPDDWLFLRRWTKKDAKTIDGHAIHFMTVGGRTSAYVPALLRNTSGKKELPSSKASRKETSKKRKREVEIKQEKSLASSTNAKVLKAKQATRKSSRRK